MSPVDHIREVGELREAMQADGLKDPTATRVKLAGRGAGGETWTPRDTRLHALALRLESAIKRAKSLDRKRTWRRERQTLIPHRLPLYGIDVGVYADLSGSTGQDWELIGAICRWLRKTHRARISVFDDGVRVWDGISPYKPASLGLQSS
jgi:hypothetical protein